MDTPATLVQGKQQRVKCLALETLKANSLPDCRVLGADSYCRRAGFVYYLVAAPDWRVCTQLCILTASVSPPVLRVTVEVFGEENESSVSRNVHKELFPSLLTSETFSPPLLYSYQYCGVFQTTKTSRFRSGCKKKQKTHTNSTDSVRC